MSKWSEKRKKKIVIIIGVVLLFIFTLVLVGLKKTKKPSCFDGVQNGQETGVDCGGECVKVCRDEVRNIVVWWERPFRVAPGVYNAVAYFENQNLDSALKKINYEFRLYDKNNILVSEPRRGSTFIEPNKRSAVFESGITTGENEAYTAFFKISSVQDWKRVDSSFSYSLFGVTDPLLTNQDLAPKVSAFVENKSFYNFKDVPVVVVLYNDDGNAIAASRTYIDSLDQGDSKKVFFLWPEPFKHPVSRIEVIPRIDPFIPISKITR